MLHRFVALMSVFCPLCSVLPSAINPTVISHEIGQTSSMGIPVGNNRGSKSFPMMNWYSSTSRSRISKICGDKVGACRMESNTMTGVTVSREVRPSDGWEME